MLKISNYQLTTQLYESANSVVYRGWQLSDEQPVVLKILKDAYPAPERIAGFKREYEVTRSLTIAGVIGTYALTRSQERLVMVLEDFGGDSLELLRIAGHLELSEFLKLALSITDILSQIHTARVIHKDINPSNIILNPTTGQVKIIDFGISTTLSQEDPIESHPNILEGTLAYVSPEQTGRMNRVIDYRSDFYSLGITFYELLTGVLPFKSLDILELIHSHIAKNPTTPKELQPELPPIISDIVLKLMAKNAEERYQSAYGLIADLELCLHQLTSKGEIESFPLGRQDISDCFQIPQKLYGREHEIEILLTAFHRASIGSSEMLLIAGYSGVGKTALVREVNKPITALRGNFIWGKFDQYKRDPYHALSQAFNKLCHYLLTENEVVLNEWREKILAAVGRNGQLLIDIIPDLEKIIGAQPSIVNVGEVEAQNRFNLVLQNFIKAICQREHPLVLFIDDIQWIDRASLTSLKTIMSESIHYLLIVCTYRDNEVGAAHPLMSLKELEKSQVTLSFLHLENLPLQTVNDLIADTLISEPQSTQLLASLVYEKTQGNSFFTHEFLKSLHAEKLVFFDQKAHRWQWDIARIKAKNITDNVVDLMADRLSELPNSTQAILQLAACIGNSFNLLNLGIICQQQPIEVLTNLLPAMQKSLVIPLDSNYKLVQAIEDELAVSEANLKFLHDRVRQAAYSMIGEAQKKATHLEIGHLLLRNTSPEALSERIFEIVDHFNVSCELVIDQDERNEIARLNLIAGRKAKSAMAHEAAVKYLNLGLNLLAEDSWQTQYELTLNLYEMAVYAEYLNTNYERAERLADLVIQKVKTVQEKVNVYEAKIQLYIAQNQMQASIDIGLEFLKILGISLSKSSPIKLSSLFSVAAGASSDGTLSIDDLYNLPPMVDPDKLVAMRILKTIWSPVHTTNSPLAPFVISTMLELSINYGNSSFAAFAYVLYGLILCSTQSNLDLGYQFGKLSLKMLKQYDSSEIEGKVNLMFNCFIRPWKEHKRATLKSLYEAMQLLIESGDIEYASYAAINYCSNLVAAGEPLQFVKQKYNDCINLVQSIRQEFSLYYAEVWRQFVLNLLGQENNGLGKEEFNETEILPLLQKKKNIQSLFANDLAKTKLGYLFGNYAAAVESAESAAVNKQPLEGLLPYAEHNFYYSLSLLANYLGQKEREQYIEKVIANQKEMKTWADHAPMNFQHTYELVEAEKARVLGQVVEAMNSYERSIKGAKNNGYIQEEALAYELAANFYRTQSLEEIAQIYMTKAHYSYVCWGATAKARDLEQRYPQFFTQEPSSSINTNTTNLSTEAKTPSDLDLTSVLKASQALSGEIMLDALLEKMMKIVLENAGAQKGYLILHKQGQWVIEASGIVDNNKFEALLSIPIEVDNSSVVSVVSLSIISYVIRTQESIILSDALHEDTFNRDPYVIQQKIRSVLCAPLLNQGRLTGLLYLENNHITRAFTRERLEVLKLLITQVSISIENAKLYTDLHTYSQELKVKNTELLAVNKQLENEITERKQTEEALRLSEERFRLAVDNIPDTFVIYNAERRFQFVNIFGVSRSGYPQEGYIGRTDEEIHPPEVTDKYLPLLQKAVETRTKQTGECEISLPGSDPFTIVITYVPLLNEQGEIHQILGITHDISKRKQTELALRESQERLQAILDNSTTMIYVRDRGGRYILANHCCATQLSVDPEEIKGKTVFDLLPHDIADTIWKNDLKVLATGNPLEFEEAIPQVDGIHTYLSLKVPLKEANGMIYAVCGISTDITERKRAEEQLLQSAYYDVVTNLPNRTLFINRLGHALEQAKRYKDYSFAVLFLDLDRFKVINDSLGHLLGDQLLLAIAGRLKACLRATDTAARLGGDEFVILIEGIRNASEAVQVAERIQQELALPFELNKQEVFATTSIGIALSSTANYEKPEDLLRDADTAMYQAKALGRSRYELFSLDMYANAVSRLQLETDLRRAIERQEFRVYYQPIVSLTSGRIVGFEALLRWQHPERGLVSPADFIPLAEETGLIVEIGYWVLQKACRQMQAWLLRYRTNLLEKISVNLSLRQSSQPNLIRQIAQILQETKLDAHCLVIEITESVIMENSQQTIATLSQLQELGLRLSIDDFGTGYSSLDRLHNLPISILKIDRSFISKINLNARNTRIVEAIVTLAQRLGIEVIAEGVETLEQLQMLRKWKCEYGQGYLFSRPLDSEAAEALIAASPSW